MTRSIFEERWTHRPEGQALCALINGDRGWLMFLRSEGDAGMSSRDPAYVGAPDAEMEFQLTNGQVDRYPVAWTLPIQDIERAIEFFNVNGDLKLTHFSFGQRFKTDTPPILTLRGGYPFSRGI